MALPALGLAVSLVALGACGSDKKKSPETTAAAETTAATTETTIGAPIGTTPAGAPETSAGGTPETTAVAPETTGAAAAAPSAAAGDCAVDKLPLVKAGQLTIGTDKPAFAPWFSNDDPTNGKGFESAVGYAIATQMGFTKDQVKWTVVPFNSSYAPGKKDFDFDLNQISITDDRKKTVDFSDGYYDVNQAVVALNGTKAADAKSIADLKALKFGAQVGTTSLDFIKQTIAPTQEAFAYDDTNAAKAALTAKQIDAVVVDLPTAFFISAAEIPNSKVVGQFAGAGGGEQFGALFEKGNPLVGCVNTAIQSLKSGGKLAQIQDAELAQATSAPVLS